MYTIDALVPFELLVDTDIGLLSLIKKEYNNEEYFLPGILNASETNLKYSLLTRTTENPLGIIMVDECNFELMDDLYNQFMSKEYDKILSLSPNTMVEKLVHDIKINIEQIVRITVLCNSEKEQHDLEKRDTDPYKVIVGSFESIDLSGYGSVFVKRLSDLDKFKGLSGKNIYIPNYSFNVTINPEVSMPLINFEYLQKYGNSNEFQVFTMYHINPRDIPLG